MIIPIKSGTFTEHKIAIDLIGETAQIYLRQIEAISPLIEKV
ncbi:MAG: hypothetical protein QNJ54_05335 [Prochloraceae cyanobacterium]|nr:hypothetical protein [Prochloraceae cyanobacterium]